MVSAPVSTIVIASDIAGAASFSAPVLDAFEQVLVAARALGFVSQDPGRPNLTLTLSPEQDAGAPLEALARAATGFDQQADPLRLRSMVHFGVVFRTESDDGVSYLGSAIRSAQSALRRAPATGGILATAEFAGFAGKLTGASFRLQPLSSGAAVEGLAELVFGGSRAAAADTPANPVDGAFIDFVKRRLADDIGPFANALVERAAASWGTPDQVIVALGKNIDKEQTRKKFEEDVLRFVKSRA